ncbi:hypothetical protein [Okeania sp. SIO1F9]|uniref:hypothetical protein n=1 Tax=Okeania sp. SIO1F9 TaxID=2607813 RepID=UPI00144CB313|nr:hypothetical protein [Okeania sp. SIO1F9]NET80322.1 hypothetical protein [Okeania sp. SIO1F9]
MKTTNTITSRLFVAVTAFALIVGSLPKEANAQTGIGGSTGWNTVSTKDEISCYNKALPVMEWLVSQGDIQKVPGKSERFKKGNNAVFDVICARNGEVKVDLICFNSCGDAKRTRDKIDSLMQW